MLLIQTLGDMIANNREVVIVILATVILICLVLFFIPNKIMLYGPPPYRDGDAEDMEA